MKINGISDNELLKKNDSIKDVGKLDGVDSNKQEDNLASASAASIAMPSQDNVQYDVTAGGNNDIRKLTKDMKSA